MTRKHLGLQCVVLVIFCIVVMTVDHRTHYLNKPRAILNQFSVPIHYLVDKPVNWLRLLGSNFTSQQQLLNDIQRLKEKQLVLKTQLLKYQTLEKENVELKALLGSTAEMGEKLLVARVLSLDMEPFVQQVLIDKGSRDGVYVGQPVLDADGVMGQVISVSGTTSRVMLVSDTKSAIPVQTVDGTVRSVAVGLGYAGELALLYVPVTTELRAGDLLVTSGLGQRYPMGYPVGIVRSMKVIPGKRFIEVKFKPNASIHTSRHVVLVWPQLFKGEL